MCNILNSSDIESFQVQFNLTSVVNKMTGLDAFVISDTFYDRIFQFNIQGYCFTVENVQELLQMLIQSDKQYLNVELQLKDGYLYDSSNTFVNTSIINISNVSLPISFTPSDQSSFSMDSNLNTKTNHCIKQIDDTCVTYVFTIVERCKKGDKIIYRIPYESKINYDESLLLLETTDSDDTVLDDGEI